MARVERYGPGDEAIDFTPGDFVLTHRHNPIAQLISVIAVIVGTILIARRARLSSPALLSDQR